MERLTMLNVNVNGLSAHYALSDIESIEHGKAKDKLSKEDCKGNNIKLNESLIVIKFKEGYRASFAEDWILTFS